MGKKKQPEYRLGYFWDDYLAEYRFQLQRDTGSSFEKPEEVEDGNLEWAERQSRHYGIDMPASYYEQHDVEATKPQAPTPVVAPTTNTTNPIAMSTPTYPITPGATK